MEPLGLAPRPRDYEMQGFGALSMLLSTTCDAISPFHRFAWIEEFPRFLMVFSDLFYHARESGGERLS